MKYLHVPRDVSSADICAKNHSFSAGMYRRVEIPTRRTRLLRDLLAGYDKGSDPGSLYYLNHSTHYLIRTKALQDHSVLLYPRGDANTPLNPRAFVPVNLTDGDILLSKDSNVGECAMVDGDRWKNCSISGGIVRLRPAPDVNRFYLFAFLKHPLFKTELLSMVPRGATIAHANTLWLDCHIPFPDQPDADRVIAYVAALTEAIVEKERAIRARHRSILAAIEVEFSAGFTGKPFVYEHPSLAEVRQSTRFDTGLYCREFKEFRHRVENYRHGAATLDALGVKSRRGPNLAVSVIGPSLYSEAPKAGWYELIRPVNINEYGTLTRKEWLGSRRALPCVGFGEIVFGSEATWRSVVHMPGDSDRCTTNFHGTILFWPGAPIEDVISVHALLNFLRDRNILRYIAVGGQGGHLSPEYFDYIPLPRLPEEVRVRLARLYHSPAGPPARPATLATLVAWHREWNEGLGIWELDREMKALRAVLAAVQEDIIEGRTVELPFAGQTALAGLA